ncbi:MAG: hypothetical protein JXR77_19410 [Lentisphaeria bacterium]|nr:hypothetical protein [Lentisphaeria bacterium]
MSDAEAGQHRLAEGSFLGSHRIVAKVAVDSDGETYLARDPGRGATVLLRLFRLRPAKDIEAVARLAERCGLAAAMQHPGIARCTPLLRERDMLYTAMELPDGPRGAPMTLAKALAETAGRLPSERVELLAEHLCQALQFAHRFRGDGMAHGRLSLDTIYLTAQRQPRIADFRVLFPADPTDDIRALGCILAQLLTGHPPDAKRVPCVPGLRRRWNRLVRRCLAAGSPDGYAGISGLLTDLASDGAAVGHGVAWGGLIALLVVILAGGIVTLQRLRRALPTQAPAAGALHQAGPARPAQALPPPRPDVAALWRQAEEARVRGDTEAAGKALEAILAATPGDAEAARRLDGIRSESSLAIVNAVKQRAEDAFRQAAGIQESDGFRTRLDALKATRQEAAGHLAALHLDRAGPAYRRLLAEAEAMVALDAARTRAARARETADAAREGVPTTGAAGAREAILRPATTCMEQARTRWDAMDFAAAEELYRQAAAMFEGTGAAAADSRRLAAARERYRSEAAKAGDDLLARVPEAARRRLAELARLAEEHAGAGRLAQAAEAWETAAAECAAALDKAATVAPTHILPARERFPRPTAGNLVLNGTLDDGADGQPTGWSRVDNLTSFWDAKGKSGHCLRFDTNVLQSDKKALQASPETFQGKSGEGQYNTVGAHEGVWAFCSPVPVLPGDRFFLLEADVMGPAKSTALFYPQILIRGYRLFDAERDEGTFSWFQTPHEGGPAFSEQFGAAQRRAQAGDYLMLWRHALVCRNSAPNLWEHYRMAIALPQEQRFRPEVILLKAYAMWPLGEYRFDNIAFRTIDEAEYSRVKAQGHSIEGFMPLE